MWTKDFFIQALSNSYGKQRAEEVVGQMFKSAGLADQDQYDKEETLKVCGVMGNSEEMFLRTIGSCLRVQVMFSEQDAGHG